MSETVRYMLHSSLISTYSDSIKTILIKEFIVQKSNVILELHLTFFCKRGRHSECPIDWPVEGYGGATHDCSFDVVLVKCTCECHTP